MTDEGFEDNSYLETILSHARIKPLAFFDKDVDNCVEEEDILMEFLSKPQRMSHDMIQAACSRMVSRPSITPTPSLVSMTMQNSNRIHHQQAARGS